MSSWWIDVENSSGVRQGNGPLLATAWRSTDLLDRAGTFSFEVPATDNRAAALLSMKRIVRCRAIVNNATVQIGAGIIESVTIRVSNGVPMRVVSGPNLLGELRRYTLDKRNVAGMADFFNWPTFVNDDKIPFKLLASYANAKTSSTWTLANAAGSTIGSGTAVTDYEVYARFREDSVLNALIRVAEVTGEHFRLGTNRQVQWIGRESEFAASGVRAVLGADGVAAESYSYLAQIADISHVEDAQGIVNRIIVYGSGQGDTRLTMRGASVWPDGTAINVAGYDTRTIGGRDYHIVVGSSSTSTTDFTLNCIEDLTSSNAYGVHEVALQINNVAPLSNTAADVEAAANQLLVAAWEYLLQHSEPRNTYSLRLSGCNTILQPGTRIPVHAQRWVDGQRPIDINETLNILGATIELDARGLRTSELVVSDGVRLPMGTGDVIAAQAAKSYVAAAHPQIGPNESTIGYGPEDMDRTHDAVLHFWLGSAITTLAQILLYFRFDPIRSTVMRHDDLTDVAHSHTTPIYQEAITTNVGLSVLGRLARGGSGGAVGNNIATSAGGFHIHPLHLGILEETAGNTLNPTTEISITVNGVATSGLVESEGDGWYSLDVTADLIDEDTLQPAVRKNVITFADSRTAINISSISKSVVTVTVTTASSHGLSTGDAVWIAGTSAYNGHHANVTVTGSTTFTFLSLSGSGTETTGTIVKYKTARVQAQIERRMSIQSIAYSN